MVKVSDYQTRYLTLTLGRLKFCEFYYRPQRSWEKAIFSQASVILSTGGGVSGCWGGACMVARKCAWLPGACMVAGGHAWLWEGACMVAGGHAWGTMRYGQ